MSDSAICPVCGSDAAVYMVLSHAYVFRCRTAGCELQFVYPQPNDSDLGRRYREMYYPGEDGSAVLRSAPDEDFAAWLAHVEQRLGSIAGKRVLDYGCGFGAALRIGAARGGLMVGIEQSDQARAAAQRVQRARVYAGIDQLLRAEPDVRFDWILVCVVVEHLRRPWEDLQRLSELLQPSGRIILSTPNFAGLKSRFAGRRWRQRTNPTHLYYFTATSLRAVIERAGLEAERWPAMTGYKKHGPLRRVLQRVLRAADLQGDLMFAARRGESFLPASPRSNVIQLDRSSGALATDQSRYTPHG